MEVFYLGLEIRDASSGESQQITRGSKILLGMVILLHGLNHLINGSLPVLYPSIMQEFQLSYLQLGFLRSAASLASGFPQAFVGILRRWLSGRVLIALGNLLNSLFCMAASLIGGFNEFLVFRVVGSVCGSPQHPIGTSMLTTNSDPSWRGRIFGLNMAASHMASTISPLVATWLLLTRGWRMSLFTMAIPTFLGSFVLLFVKDIGDGEVRTHSFSLSEFVAALKNKNVLSISLLRTVMAFRMGVRAFIPLYFINVLGMTTGLSSTLYSVMILGGIIGPFFWGYLSDRMPRRPLIILILAFQGILYYSIQLVVDIWLLVLLLFMIGFMVQTVIMQSVLAESTDRKQLDHVFGFFYTLGFTLGSISSVIFAYVIEVLGFNYGFTYIAVVSMLAIVPALFIKETRTPAS